MLLDIEEIKRMFAEMGLTEKKRAQYLEWAKEKMPMAMHGQPVIRITTTTKTLKEKDQDETHGELERNP